MKNISKFDIGIVIAFVVIALLGGGVCYWLSTQLDAAKGDVSTAASDFQKYTSHEVYLPTASNQKTLQANIDLMQGRLDPLVQNTLAGPGNKLASITIKDPVAWKHDLDDEVSGLNAAAKTHGVTVPPNFYYGFSRYLNVNPGDEQTAVLSKQLLGIDQIAKVFINAPVKAITAFRRTYEEDPDTAAANSSPAKSTDSAQLPGRAMIAPGGIYISYPFEIEFDGTTENLRTIVDQLAKAPYVFIIRTISLKNSAPDSPQPADLEKIAAPSQDSNGDSTKSTKGPQFLFGNESLHVKMRIDLIEWKGMNAEPAATAGAGTGTGHRRGPASGDNR